MLCRPNFDRLPCFYNASKEFSSFNSVVRKGELYRLIIYYKLFLN